MADEEIVSTLRSLAPPGEDPQSLIADVRRRHDRRRRRTTALAATALGCAVVAGGALALRPDDGGAAADEPGSLSPVCGFAPPFVGFEPGTDTATIARTRGAAPTDVVSYAGRGNFTLHDVRIRVEGRGGVVRDEALGSMPADGQELRLVVGDVADDGTAIAPGRYAVTLSATVRGRNLCGEDAMQIVDRTAGFLVVR